MKINLKILSTHFVSAKDKCEDLEEKILVPKMMLRRRLTRSSKIAIYLASKVDYTNERIVFGSAYGEAKATIDIIDAIYNKTLLSPTAFQNSVHNTPVSYLSILSENTNEVVTVSDLFNTSLSVLKTGAIKALKKDKLLLMCVDAFNIDKVSELNKCNISDLESGVGMLVEMTEEPANIFLENRNDKEVSPSLWQMLEIHKKAKNIQNPIVEIEL
jgi:hypothetical protein